MYGIEKFNVLREVQAEAPVGGGSGVPEPIVGQQAEINFSTEPKPQEPTPIDYSTEPKPKFVTEEGYIKPLGKDASEEDVAAYREAIGAKGEIDLHKLELDPKYGDHEWSKDVMDSFAERISGNNIPDAQAKEIIQQAMEFHLDQVESNRELEEQRLQEQWGAADFQGNSTALRNFVTNNASQEAYAALTSNAELANLVFRMVKAGGSGMPKAPSEAPAIDAKQAKLDFLTKHGNLHELPTHLKEEYYSI